MSHDAEKKRSEWDDYFEKEDEGQGQEGEEAESEDQEMADA
jgi:hypothetical protein